MDNVVAALPRGGFSFENSLRNTRLEASGHSTKMMAHKTGTTIAGVIFKGGVVLGADTRATGGSTVVDKNCEKIHYIAPNVYCCGAGTAADTEMTTQLISSKLHLHRMSTNRTTRVGTALTMLKQMLFRYQGHVSAALVLGGCDPVNGAQLFTVAPHGSTDKLPYVTMGSGSLAAMAMFESGFKEDMSEDEAKDLVHAAISSGIFNDLGSGSNVDLTVIREDGSVSVLRNYDTPNDRSFRKEGGYKFEKGTTPVVSEIIAKVKKLDVEVTEAAPMDL